MKTTCMLSLPFVFSAAVVAQADTSAVPISNLTFAHRTNLIDTDQSQTFETLSVADEFTRLPVSSYQTAGVYFITSNKGQVFSKLGNGGSGGGTGGPEFEDPTIKQCIGDGYKYNASNCPSGLPADTCPHNTGYFKTCCDVVYNYTEENCSLLNKSSSCGNKYKCDCSEEKYPVTANSCTSPQIPTTESGASCTVNGQIRYTKCVCPTGVSAPYGCEDYYSGACNTVCKKAKSDNCDNRTAVQIPYGCESYYADCSSKCEKAYTDNCRNRTAVSAPNGCEQYYADCSSKCEIAKAKPADNCDIRTDVISSCPKNARCYSYSDCSSKIESWSCYSGYVKNGDKCRLAVPPLPIVYGDGTVAKEFIDDKRPIAIVFDEENSLALAISYVVLCDQIDGTKGMCIKGTEAKGSKTTRPNIFSSNSYDIPNLENCTTSNYSTCGTDGKANTDKILACGSDCVDSLLETGVKTYVPLGFDHISYCSADFCQPGKWFIPSASDWDKIRGKKGSINVIADEYNTRVMFSDRLDYGSLYWSSTEISSDEMFVYDAGSSYTASEIKTKKKDYKYVSLRLMIKY